MTQSLEYERTPLSPVLIENGYKNNVLLQYYFNLYFTRVNFPLPITGEEGVLSIYFFTTRGMDTF